MHISTRWNSRVKRRAIVAEAVRGTCPNKTWYTPKPKGLSMEIERFDANFT